MMNKTIHASILLTISILIFWELLGKHFDKFKFFASRPSDFFSVWLTELTRASYWLDLNSTCSTLFVGYGIALVLGYCIGVGTYWLKSKGITLEVWLLILGSVPVFALAPLLILALGAGIGTRIAVVILSTVFLVSSGVYQSCKYADEQFGSIARDLSAKESLLWLKIILPGGVIFSIPTLKGGVALSLIGIFVAEWISSTHGLGKYILSAMSLYDAARLVVGILSFMVVSSIAMIIITVIEDRTTRWRSYR